MAVKRTKRGRKCLIKGCSNLGQFRGLCPRCHQCARRAINEGLTTEEELMEKGLMLSSARGHRKRKSPWIVQFERDCLVETE